jgi:hypothetical protein
MARAAILSALGIYHTSCTTVSFCCPAITRTFLHDSPETRLLPAVGAIETYVGRDAQMHNEYLAAHKHTIC